MARLKLLTGALLRGLVLGLGCVAGPASAGDAPPRGEGRITMGAAELYAGFEARKVLLDRAGGRLVLDRRVFEYGLETEGRVVTDPSIWARPTAL